MNEHKYNKILLLWKRNKSNDWNNYELVFFLGQNVLYVLYAVLKSLMMMMTLFLKTLITILRYILWFQYYYKLDMFDGNGISHNTTDPS